MAWWVWLLFSWPVVALLGACVLGLALKRSDHLEWVSHGRPERRATRRPRDREDA
jgi:hypothetical protein